MYDDLPYMKIYEEGVVILAMVVCFVDINVKNYTSVPGVLVSKKFRVQDGVRGWGYGRRTKC